MTITDNLPRLPDVVEVNGIKITVEMLIQMAGTLTNPDPKRWYRFERKGGEIIVETMRK
jgi:hypothetical protein